MIQQLTLLAVLPQIFVETTINTLLTSMFAITESTATPSDCTPIDDVSYEVTFDDGADCAVYDGTTNKGTTYNGVSKDSDTYVIHPASVSTTSPANTPPWLDPHQESLIFEGKSEEQVCIHHGICDKQHVGILLCLLFGI